MMQYPLLAGVMLAFATPAVAASPVDGTWKTDLSSVQFSKKPDVVLLKDGVYSCTSCAPSYSVKADGEFHKITGQPYFDEASVKAVDANTIEETDKLKGKVVSTTRATLSADGKSVAIHWTDSSAPDGTTTSGDVTQMRVGDAPAGSHAASGSWQTSNAANFSDSAITMTLMVKGDMLSMKTPTGYHYDAKVGGPAVPIVGDNAGTKVTVRKVGDGYEESDWRDGKVVSVYTMVPTADGKLKYTIDNKLRDSSMTMMLIRQ